jgi:NADH:ubiquinone oxidoreductase subunit
MSIGTKIFTMLNGKLVGTDSDGNQYYIERRNPKGRRRRRWVMYKGAREASRVPAEWHGWLHYSVDATPDEQKRSRRGWEKQHQPNLTGTMDAYHPSGSEYEGGHRAPATGDYEPWRPA